MSFARNARRAGAGVAVLALAAGSIATVMVVSPSVASASTPPLTSVTQIEGAEGQSCAVLANGTVRCWGDRSFGRLGNTSSEKCGGVRACSTIPLVVQQHGDVLSNIVEVSNGTRHTCALRADATAWCWGENSDGDLGNRSTTDSSVAVQVRNETDTGPLVGVAHVYAASFMTCAAMLDGTARCWGGYGGPNNSLQWLPSVVTGANGTPITHVLQVKTGPRSNGPMCVLLDDHTARCWGFNEYGQSGDGTRQGSSVPVTVKNPAGTGPLTGIDDLTLSLQDMNVCARLHDGTAACWGINQYGQLGVGTTSGPQICGSGLSATGCSDLPVIVQNGAGTGPLTGVVDVRAGFDDACARLDTGTVTCWGRNATGQLGDGTTTDRSLPVAVRNRDNTGELQGVAAIATGAHHACARLDDGGANCWGANLYGQLGDGTSTASPLPVVVGNGGLAVTDPPNPPTDVVATAGFEEASVSWTAPVDNGTPIISYRVTVSPGGQWILVNAPSTNGIVAGLSGGVDYSFSVHAISSQGDSLDATSNQVTVIGPPGPPTDPVAAPGNTTATITWIAPARAGSSPITGYIVTPYVDDVAQPTQQFGATTTATISGLTNGQSFRFSVAAQNDSGTGPDSDLSYPIAIGAPAVPAAPHAVQAGDGRARISWTAPDSQGSPITSYAVVSFFGPGDPDQSVQYNSTATTQLFTGLRNGRMYTFTVRAINAYGSGLPSEYSRPIKVGIPTAPTGVRADPVWANARKGSLVVSFVPGSGETITVQGAVCRPSNGGSLKGGLDGTGTARSITVHGVNTGWTYTCVVRARNDFGVSPASAASNAVVVGSPARPHNVHAVRVGPGRLQVTFTPGAKNGAPSTGYTVVCTSSNGGTAGAKTGAGSPVTVGALTAGKTYICSVTGTNQRGAGPPSNTSAPVTA